MIRRHAEVYHQLAEFIAERGLWQGFCDHCERLGITPEDIACALNDANTQAGYSDTLAPEDCEP